MPNVPADARYYAATADWAGLGFPHHMVAWTDPDGTPRSFCWVQASNDAAYLRFFALTISNHESTTKIQEGYNDFASLV